MHNIETFHNKTLVAAGNADFRFEGDLFQSVPTIISFVVMDNIETFQNQNMVVPESIGFRSEADLFKTVKIIIGFGCHGEH